MTTYYENGAKLDVDAVQLSGRHAVGQPVRLNYTDYKVAASRIVGDTEEVDLIRCEVCPKCGGIKGDPSGVVGCSPRFCR